MQMPKLSALFLMRPTEIKLLLEPASHTQKRPFCLSTPTHSLSQTASDAEILLRARALTSGKGWPLHLTVTEATSSEVLRLSDHSRLITPHFRTLSGLSAASQQSWHLCRLYCCWSKNQPWPHHCGPWNWHVPCVWHNKPLVMWW